MLRGNDNSNVRAYSGNVSVKEVGNNAIKGAEKTIQEKGEVESLRFELSAYMKEIEHLKQIIEEKERTIQILLNRGN